MMESITYLVIHEQKESGFIQSLGAYDSYYTALGKCIDLADDLCRTGSSATRRPMPYTMTAPTLAEGDSAVKFSVKYVCLGDDVEDDTTFTEHFTIVRCKPSDSSERSWF